MVWILPKLKQRKGMLPGLSAPKGWSMTVNSGWALRDHRNVIGGMVDDHWVSNENLALCRHGERWHPRGHTVRRWQNTDSNPGLCDFSTRPLNSSVVVTKARSLTSQDASRASSSLRMGPVSWASEAPSLTLFPSLGVRWFECPRPSVWSTLWLPEAPGPSWGFAMGRGGRRDPWI